MERENQRIAITKRLLKESLLRLLKDKDADSISVTELCREAGINRATFYRHYGIPGDLLLEIQKDLYRELRKNVRLPSSVQDVHGSILQLCNFIEEHSHILRLLFLRAKSDGELIAFLEDVYRDLWQEYQNLELIRHLDPEGLRILSLYSAGGSFLVIRSWLLGDINKSADELASYICSLLEKTDWKKVGVELGILSEI